MKDDWFWRVFAVGALLVALGYVVSRFTAAPPVHAGGDGGFIMEAASSQGTVDKVYVLDTTRKCLILYGSPSRHDLTMLASRYIGYDCEATVGMEFVGRSRGYSATDVKRELDRKKGTGARRAR